MSYQALCVVQRSRLFWPVFNSENFGEQPFIAIKLPFGNLMSLETISRHFRRKIRGAGQIYTEDCIVRGLGLKRRAREHLESVITWQPTLIREMCKFYDKCTTLV